MIDTTRNGGRGEANVFTVKLHRETELSQKRDETKYKKEWTTRLDVGQTCGKEKVRKTISGGRRHGGKCVTWNNN